MAASAAEVGVSSVMAALPVFSWWSPECEPSCTMVGAREGVFIYKYIGIA